MYHTRESQLKGHNHRGRRGGGSPQSILDKIVQSGWVKFWITGEKCDKENFDFKCEYVINTPLTLLQYYAFKLSRAHFRFQLVKLKSLLCVHF